MTIALEDRRGPQLMDGTWLGDIIDFDKREVAMRVLSDPEVHRLEMERIFARSWIALGHVAEIPEPGDFVLRAIGEDTIIVTRDRADQVRLLLNACAHRGMEVCWAEHGSQATFKCPYHGWVFDSTGALTGAPFEREMYGDWDRSEFGLRKVRVGVHKGRIFGNLDDDAMPLDEWLADAAFYMDRPYLNEDPELEVCQRPRRFRVKANWKIAADNNSGDNYHGMSLHRSLSEMGFAPGDPGRSMRTVKVSSDLGHGMVGFPLNIMDPNAPPGPPSFEIDNFTFTCALFPASFGVGGSANHRHPTPDGGSVLVVDLGGLVPQGPGEFEMWTARLVQKDAPAMVKQQLKSALALDLGGVDDMEAWPSMQRAARGVAGMRQPMRYNTLAGENKPAGWPGPGKVYAGISRDDSQWNWWRRWFEMMTADEAKAGA